jgi:uncharacterized protein with HEPN domain
MTSLIVMELKIIGECTLNKISDEIKQLLEKSRKLRSSQKENKYLDNQDVCLLLNISPRTLQTYRDKRILPYTQIDRKCYYKLEDVNLFIEKNMSVTK